MCAKDGDDRRSDGITRSDGSDCGRVRSGIDTTKEELLSLSEAAKRVPTLNGRRIHSSTIFRWCRRGLRGVRLEYIRVGRRMATTAEALDRFYRDLARADGEAPESRPAPEAPKSPSQAARDHAIAQAEATLDADGLS